MEKIILELDVQKVNKILEALQERPFRDVHLLIGEIIETAEAQVAEQKKIKEIPKKPMEVKK